MRSLLAAAGVVIAGTALAAVLFVGVSKAPAEPGPKSNPAPATAPDRLVVHEWGTFTSFSGSDGVPVGFYPNNSDLPSFVYHQGNELSKAGRLAKDGTVSMETPVLYFYTDKSQQASVRVDFPKGWITEWYPYAAGAPVEDDRRSDKPGQSIRWNVKLLAGASPSFPREKADNHYYPARETDAVPVETEFTDTEDRRDWALRGGSVIQREKFLFYRGVGRFAPPVLVRPEVGGQIRVKNTLRQPLNGLVLVSVHSGKIGFKSLGEVDAGAEMVASLNDIDTKSGDLAEVMVKNLTGAGLYEKEARAMVKTWDSAWFHEEGNRLLYLVPRARTDELLPLTVDPKPTELVRVLVGRHDFLTPEQESQAERLVERERAAQAELQAAGQELSKIGRFSPQARDIAARRLETRTVKK
jgi:hypothetical protein